MAFKEIPVTGAQVSGSHSDMPLLVQPSAMSGWTSLTLAEAESLRFYSDSGKTTELAREVVAADEIHVKVSSVSSSFSIYADYDGVRADYGSTDTYGRNNVWSDYEAVYHMNQSPGSLIDSTGNGNDAVTANGSMSSSDVVSAVIGDGIEFDGSNDRVDFGNSLNLQDTFTLQTWMNSPSGSDHEFFGNRQDGGNFQGFALRGPGGRAEIIVRDSGGTQKQARSTQTIDDSSDHMIHATLDKSSATGNKVYIDGSEVTYERQQDPTSVNDISSNDDFEIGAVQQGALGYYTGILDEVRLRDSVLSSNWITTEYNNQNAPGTFWGTVTDAGGGGGGATTAAARRAIFFGI